MTAQIASRAIPCDECIRYQEPPADATWAFTVMGISPRSTARMVACDRHAEWYRAKGDQIYPSERIAARLTEGSESP